MFPSLRFKLKLFPSLLYPPLPDNNNNNNNSNGVY